MLKHLVYHPIPAQCSRPYMAFIAGSTCAVFSSVEHYYQRVPVGTAGFLILGHVDGCRLVTSVHFQY